MTTLEIPNTREHYDDLNWKKSNSLVCSSWYHTNVAVEKNRKYKPFTKQNIYTHKYKGKTVVGYICGGHEPE